MHFSLWIYFQKEVWLIEKENSNHWDIVISKWIII